MVSFVAFSPAERGTGRKKTGPASRKSACRMKEESLAHLDNRSRSRRGFACPGSSGDPVANGLYGGTGASSHAAETSRGRVRPGKERLAITGRWQPSQQG